MNGDFGAWWVRRPEIVGDDALVATTIVVGYVLKNQFTGHVTGASVRWSGQRHHLAAFVHQIVFLPDAAHRWCGRRCRFACKSYVLTLQRHFRLRFVCDERFREIICHYQTIAQRLVKILPTWINLKRKLILKTKIRMINKLNYF